MSNLTRTLVGVLIVTSVLSVATIVSGEKAIESEQALLPPPTASRVDQIAYVSPIGSIWLMSPRGDSPLQVSPSTDEFYTWPTWSPDASQLVYSGARTDALGRPQVSLYSFDIKAQEGYKIHEGERGVATLLANGVVHYPLWSPDSQRLAFVGATRQGLTLFVDDLSRDINAVTVLKDGPIWINWSPSSTQLLVHRGPDHFLVDVGDNMSVSDLEVLAGDYRVPAWRPNKNDIALVLRDEGNAIRLVLIELNLDGISGANPIGTVIESPAFLWSPDSELLAIANGTRVILYQNLSLFVHQDLTLIHTDESEEPVGIPGNVLAYFWSPDSTKLAYVTLSDVRGVVRWMIHDVQQGTSWPLIDFVPSIDQLTMFQFFDQYAYSHSLWSPESDALVFAGNLRTEAAAASESQPVSNIIVINVEPNSSPQVLADGILGVWSPG